MISKDTITVIKREIMIRWNKGFLITSIAIPAIMFAIVGVQGLMVNMSDDGTESNITITTSPNSSFLPLLKETLEQTDYVKSGLYKIYYEAVTEDQLESYISSQKEQLLDDDYRSIFHIPDSAVEDKKITFYSANTGNKDVRDKISVTVNKVLNMHYFNLKDIQADIQFIQQDVEISGIKVTSGGTETESYGPAIIGWVLAFLLMLGITFNSLPLMNIVVEEKAGRVYEILLSSLKPKDLMAGKVIGAAIMGTLQMLIWVLAFAVITLFLQSIGDNSDQPNLLRMDLSFSLVIYYLVNYITGLTLFLTLYVGLSAMHDNASSANASLWPLYAMILIPFYTVLALSSNPANSFAAILSMTPLTSFYVMPARMALIDVPAWQPLLTMTINLIILYGATIITGKIYKISVLSSGTRPTLRQTLTWLKEG